jgi:hypothetical protein
MRFGNNLIITAGSGGGGAEKGSVVLKPVSLLTSLVVF